SCSTIICFTRSSTLAIRIPPPRRCRDFLFSFHTRRRSYARQNRRFPALGNLPILCTPYRKVNFSRSRPLRTAEVDTSRTLAEECLAGTANPFPHRGIRSLNRVPPGKPNGARRDPFRHLESSAGVCSYRSRSRQMHPAVHVQHVAGDVASFVT